MLNLREAATAAGLNYRTAARWLELGVVTSSGYTPGAGKQGHPVVLDDKSIVELVNLAQLRHFLSLQALRRAGQFLRETLHHNPFSSGKFIVVEGAPGSRELVKVCDGGEAIRLLREPGQLVLPFLNGGDGIGR